MQPDPSRNTNAKVKLPHPVTVLAPSSGQLSSMLPYKTTNTRDFYHIGKNLGQGQFGTMY
jgi:hypothetical protein